MGTPADGDPGRVSRQSVPAAGGEDLSGGRPAERDGQVEVKVCSRIENYQAGNERKVTFQSIVTQTAGRRRWVGAEEGRIVTDGSANSVWVVRGDTIRQCRSQSGASSQDGVEVKPGTERRARR